MMDKAGFLDRLGKDNVCADIDAALARAREILHLPPPSDPQPEQQDPKVRPGLETAVLTGRKGIAPG
jgi:hypothetical protein